MKFIISLIVILAAFCGFIQVFPRQAEYLKLKVEWLIAPSQASYTIMGLIMLLIIIVAFCFWARIRGSELWNRK